MKRVLLCVLVLFMSPVFCLGEGLQDKAQKQKIEKQEIDLSPEEKKTLDIGELGAVRYAIGGAIGTYSGFGLGHLIQGRWISRGWIFTLGEAVSATAVAVGISDCLIDLTLSIFRDNYCEQKSLLLNLGLISLAGFKIWGIIDVWGGGYIHRKNYMHLKKKLNPKDKVSFFVMPQFGPKHVGLNLRLSF